MITRKQAIRVMAGILAAAMGSFRKAYGQQDWAVSVEGKPLFTLHFGDVVPPPPPPPLGPCPAFDPNHASFIVGDCLEPDGRHRYGDAWTLSSGEHFVPGTASVEVDLNGFRSFVFKNGSESVTITRQEMWEALKS